MSTLGETPGMPGEEGAAPPNGNNTSSPLSSSTSPRRKKKLLQAIMNDYTTKNVRVKVGNEEVLMTGRELEEEMMIMDEMEEEENVMGGGDDVGISGDQGVMTMGQMMNDGGGVGKCTFLLLWPHVHVLDL
jgi:hypothetical protein